MDEPPVSTNAMKPGRGELQESALLRSLRLETEAYPYEPKRLIGPDVYYGRELLAALAQRTGGWIGWTATSLRRLADEVAFVPLHAAGIRIGSDISIRVLVNRALEGVIQRDLVSREFARLGRSVGFRQALLDSVLELRVGGITPDALHAVTATGSPARGVAAVLGEYEALLQKHRTADPAGVFEAALANFDDQAPYCLDGRLLLAPSIVERGLPGAFLERLVSFGAQRLDCDKEGVNATHVDMFVATSPADELREVFRRVVAEGLRWDEVEIVSTNVDTYGVSLDVLCQQTGIGGTMTRGIPLARTRFGRILERCFTWLGDGLPADVLREALEAGEIGANVEVQPVLLARKLRKLHIGWGRGRYTNAVDHLNERDAESHLRRYDDESEDEFRVRVAFEATCADALRTVLQELLVSTPPVPERGDDTVIRSSVSKLATATLGWISLAYVHGPAESQTRERVCNRLRDLVEVDDAETTFGAALATLRDALSDMRAWPLMTSEAKPWAASGGMVHLTDVAHAGTTGRARAFLVGLDADATAGPSRQDPLIADPVRAALQHNALSTSAQRRQDRAEQIASALASARGRITLSYAAARSADAGEARPAPELLQLRRTLDCESNLSYAELRARLGAPACAVPSDTSGGSASLDARDVWFGALSDGTMLLDGESLVRAYFKGLDSGMRAAVEMRRAELTQFNGLVRRAAGELDPRDRLDRPISPSSLELLAKCPLAWFYRYGLWLRAPEDPEYDPEAWLDSRQRGALLHQIFEQFGVRFADRMEAIATPAASREMDAIVDEIIAQWQVDVPPPGGLVLAQEIDELRRAAASFHRMESDARADGDTATWRHLEYAFGEDGQSVHYTLTDGSSLPVRGRVDRIDALTDGSFRVVDYKAGRPDRFRSVSKMGRFNGGRQLQPAIYAGALQDLLGGDVSRFEYRFPTERGHNETIAYDSTELAGARPVVTQLLEHVRDGEFIPTTDMNDCRYCDARTICRTREDNYGMVRESPRAEWAKANSGLDAFRGMRERRGIGESE